MDDFMNGFTLGVLIGALFTVVMALLLGDLRALNDQEGDENGN